MLRARAHATAPALPMRLYLRFTEVIVLLVSSARASAAAPVTYPIVVYIQRCDRSVNFKRIPKAIAPSGPMSFASRFSAVSVDIPARASENVLTPPSPIHLCLRSSSSAASFSRTIRGRLHGMWWIIFHLESCSDLRSCLPDYL